MHLEKQPSEVFCKKCALKNVANFTGKHLCLGLFLIKLQGVRPATLLKRDSGTGLFPVKSMKYLRTPILKNICERLLLHLFHFISLASNGIPPFAKVDFDNNIEDVFGHVGQHDDVIYADLDDPDATPKLEKKASMSQIISNLKSKFGNASSRRKGTFSISYIKVD